MREEVIHVERIYEGRLISLRIDHVRFVSGRKTKREIVEHPGAAAILAFTEEGRVVLIKQYRRAIYRVVYEIPAGKKEEGEDIRDTAIRELEEEAGYNAGKVRKLFDAFSTPGRFGWFTVMPQALCSGPFRITSVSRRGRIVPFWEEYRISYF